MSIIDTSLDMTRGKDREYLRTAINRGWGLTQEDLAFYAKLLKTAALKAAQDGDTREMNSCVKTAACIAGMIQKDEHLAAGANVVGVQVNVNVVQVTSETYKAV